MYPISEHFMMQGMRDTTIWVPLYTGLQLAAYMYIRRISKIIIMFMKHYFTVKMPKLMYKEYLEPCGS